VAYWGLFRLGELLPEKERKFDIFSHLLWKDITLLSDRAIFNIKSPKINIAQNRRVILFKLGDGRFCPVSALKSLKKVLKKRNLLKDNKPVFLRGSGRSFSRKTFLRSVNSVLNLDVKKKEILSGKSFRSGIPSELAASPSLLCSENVMKTLGRWKGPSYRKYIRDPIPENHWIFHSVSSLLLNRLSVSRRKGETSQEKDQVPGHQQ
jgi:hypothetical protein